MTADGQQIDMKILHRKRDLAEKLDGIGVKQRVFVMEQSADFRDRLDCSHFIVGRHDADQDGVGTQGSFHILDTYQAVFINGQFRYLKSALLQRPACFQHRRVLDLRGDDVSTYVTPLFCGTLNGQVVGLRSSAGEHDFPRAFSPSARRSCLRACSTASWACCPQSCKLLGLPNSVSMY